MAKQKEILIGWTLVAAACSLLAVEGNAGLLGILLPISLLLAYGAARSRKPGNQPDEQPRMRVG
jgi:hypothetical protein